MWDKIKSKVGNLFGVNAKTPASPNQSNYTLPQNQTISAPPKNTGGSNLTNWSNWSIPTNRGNAVNPNSTTDRSKLTVGMNTGTSGLLNSNLFGNKTSPLLTNFGKSPTSTPATSTPPTRPTTSPPPTSGGTLQSNNLLTSTGHPNSLQSQFPPTNQTIYQPGGQTAYVPPAPVDRSKLTVTGTNLQDATNSALKDILNQPPMGPQPNPAFGQGTQTGATPPMTDEQKRAEIARIQAEIARLEKERDAQAKLERQQAKDAKNKKKDKTVGEDSYWKQLLDQGKAGTQGETPKIVQDSMARITNLQQQMADLERDYGMRSAGANVKGRDLAVKAGRGRELQQNYQAEKNALAQQLNQANTQLQAEVGMYGTQTGLLQNLIGQTGPQMQFGQITDPLTGMPMSGGQYGNNPQLQNAVMQAVGMVVNNKADPNDPQVQALLSTFGLPGQSLFNQYMQAMTGGNYNPTAMSASVQAQTGQATDYGKQAYNLDTALKQVSTITPLLTDFLRTSGINPTDSAVLNQPINTYIQKLGTQATVPYNALLNELQNFSSAILNSGTALTPSAVSDATALQNPGNLSLAQLGAYIQNIEKAGQGKLAVLQQQAQGLGYQGNVGAPATASTQATPMPASTAPFGKLTDPFQQGAAGVGLGVANWGLDQASNLGGEIVGYLAGRAMPR